MVQYFIANPEAKELIVFPDGKAFLTNTTSQYDADNYAKATGQSRKSVLREDFKKEIEAELARLKGEVSEEPKPKVEKEPKPKK